MANLIPMLVDGGFDTIAITRKMTQPYEDALHHI